MFASRQTFLVGENGRKETLGRLGGFLRRDCRTHFLDRPVDRGTGPQLDFHKVREVVMARSSDRTPRRRLAAIFLILAGVFFTLFPVIRPFFDETTIAAAAGFSSAGWILAHASGMAGFILLSLGLLGVYIRLQQTSVERRSFLALLLCWVGVGLTLPFFGAEAFGLQVIGKTALDLSSMDILRMANQVRFGPGLWFISAGLLLIAAATILLATAFWKAGMRPRWGGLPLAIGFVVYIPQLQGAPVFQPIRIAVGLIITVGCVLIARGILSEGKAVK
jgi:hypothetical protein